jgi:guanylate kinase
MTSAQRADEMKLREWAKARLAEVLHIEETKVYQRMPDGSEVLIAPPEMSELKRKLSELL